LDALIIDVEYLGKSNYIACCLLAGDRPVIIDPGPAVSLGTLEEGLARFGLKLTDLHGILLTHIHLDHAGATGSIVARNPKMKVYVHERGAPHMIDPTRLLRSAKRLYGNQMDAMWGEFLPIPLESVRVLKGGEVLEVAGRHVDVAYTPGHASHHVSYLDTANGTVFVGDTAGIRIANNPHVLPVTPPPDIDLEAWEESLQRIERWKPTQLFVTHFGPATGVGAHLAQHREQLHRWAETVRAGVESDATDEECIEEFTRGVVADLEEHVSAEEVAVYRHGAGPEMSWNGLARYWRKKSEESK